MPRYRYKCGTCETVITVFHSYNEKIEDCDVCGTKENLTKLLNIPYIQKTQEKEALEIGDITKKFIEENREILRTQKEETRNKKYDKT